MTIRMQESEAAANFQQFLAYLKAGDQVQLEQNGETTGLVTLDGRGPEERPGHIAYIRKKLLELEEEHGPLIVDEGYTAHMRKAHEELNQPLELRTAWG